MTYRILDRGVTLLPKVGLKRILNKYGIQCISKAKHESEVRLKQVLTCQDEHLKIEKILTGNSKDKDCLSLKKIRGP